MSLYYIINDNNAYEWYETRFDFPFKLCYDYDTISLHNTTFSIDFINDQ